VKRIGFGLWLLGALVAACATPLPVTPPPDRTSAEAPTARPTASPVTATATPEPPIPFRLDCGPIERDRCVRLALEEELAGTQRPRPRHIVTIRYSDIGGSNMITWSDGTATGKIVDVIE
jgi:hypothetical protein